MIVKAFSRHHILPCDILQFAFSVSCQRDNRKNTEVGHSPCCDQNLIWSNSLRSPETTQWSIFTQNMFGCCRIFLSMILLSYVTCEGDSLCSEKRPSWLRRRVLLLRNQTGVCDHQTDHSAAAICVRALSYSRADQMSLLHKWHHLHIFFRTELQ